MDELRFDGRVVIVTGAGRGVGRCHALDLARRGAQVVVADLGGALEGGGSSAEPAEQVVAEIEAAGGQAVACHASVAEEDGAASIVQAAIDAFGKLDVVINNAGIAAPDWFEDTPLERVRKMVEVHYLGTVYVTRAAWPHLIEAGDGRVVNTASEAALGFVPKGAAYGGAKGAVLSFTRELALEAPRHGMHVNAVMPRAQTRLSAPEVMAHTYDVPVELFDGGGMDQYKPELVSPAAVFLAHESCPLNGEVLISGGGQVMRMAFVCNEGIANPEMTAEDVAAGLDTIMDLTGGHEVKVETLAGEAIEAAREEAGTA